MDKHTLVAASSFAIFTVRYNNEVKTLSEIEIKTITIHI